MSKKVHKITPKIMRLFAEYLAGGIFADFLRFICGSFADHLRLIFRIFADYLITNYHQKIVKKYSFLQYYTCIYFSISQGI